MTNRFLPPFGSRLSPVERRILALIADGADLRAVAEDLGISRHTVRDRLGAIGSRLGTSTQAGHIGAAVRTGQLKLAPLTVVEPVICQCQARCVPDAAAGRGLPALLARRTVGRRRAGWSR